MVKLPEALMFAEAQALITLNSHALTALEADFVRRLGYLLLRKVDRVAATEFVRERFADPPEPAQTILDLNGQTVRV
jgi:hypothetical protein